MVWKGSSKWPRHFAEAGGIHHLLAGYEDDGVAFGGKTLDQVCGVGFGRRPASAPA